MNNSHKPGYKIIMMEDHDKAYYAWRESGIKDKTLVHIDAHIDLNWLPEMDLNEIDLTTPEELSHLLTHQPLWNPFNKQRQKMVHMGNYIFPALREGMVKRLYWVVPEPTWQSRHGLRYIKKQIQHLVGIKRYVDEELKINKDYFYCRILNKDIFVCTLSGLKHMDEPILLDIDLDFLLTPLIWDDVNPLRQPWIFPEQLKEKIDAKKLSIDILTIAYSVEGGFTPLRYKYLGGELRFLFEGNLDIDERNVIEHRRRALECEREKRYAEAISLFEDALRFNGQDASLYFSLCLLYLKCKKPDLKKARYFYHKAITKDKTYGSAYNNYGIIYQQQRKLKEAEQEYKTFLNLDENNQHILNGLGYIALAHKDYGQAEEFFNQVLRLNQNNLEAILGKGVIYFKTRRIEEARGLFLKGKEISQDNPEIFWWLARISQKRGNITEAINYYKDTVLAGAEGPLVHLLLFGLYFLKGFFLRAKEELGRCLYLFYKSFFNR